MTARQKLQKIIQESIQEVQHDYDERQELMLLMQIQSAARWLKANPKAKPEDLAHAVDLIVGRVDEIIGMHKKMKEVAPSGWEGTVKAMKKHGDIDNPWALAHWMKNKGMKSHK